MAAMLRESVIAGVIVRTNEQYLCYGIFTSGKLANKREKNIIEMDFQPRLENEAGRALWFCLCRKQVTNISVRA